MTQHRKELEGPRGVKIWCKIAGTKTKQLIKNISGDHPQVPLRREGLHNHPGSVRSTKMSDYHVQEAVEDFLGHIVPGL